MLLHPASPECMSMTNFVVYLIGTLLVVAGLAYGASRLGRESGVDRCGRSCHHRTGPDGRNREDETKGSGVLIAGFGRRWAGLAL